MSVVSNKESVLRDKITQHFLTIGVNPEHLSEWWTLGDDEYPRTYSTLRKIWKNRPSAETYKKWCEAPKGVFTSLQGTTNGGGGVRYPLLCGWTQEQVLDGLRPYVRSIAIQFQSARSEKEDCIQNGAIGIIHALRTDAGISAFASHAYSRIKTMIRRKSANSGVIAQPERRPSRTEVRRVITAWLNADLLNLEMQARIKGGKTFDDLSKPEQKKVKKQSEEGIITLGKRGAPINRKRLLRKGMLTEYAIQKIGQRDVTELHVREGTPLSVFPLDKTLELLDYLEVKFHCMDKLDYDLTKFKTVADLCNKIADSPDFHGNPIPLSVEVDDGYSLHEAIGDGSRCAQYKGKWHVVGEPTLTPTQQAIRNEDTERAKTLVAKIREATDLTDNQELVLAYTYGLDGKPVLQGSEIADRFGELMGEKPVGKDRDGNPVYRSVSRQRIMQHQKIVKQKIRDAANKILFNVGKMATLKKAIISAGLDKSQSRLARRYFGIDTKKMDIPTIADNYEEITGKDLPPNIQPKQREYVVTEAVRAVEDKIGWCLLVS
jgi:hypothetical protein